MILYKEIKLLPTEYTLDVWVCDDYTILDPVISELYSIDDEVLYSSSKNCVITTEIPISDNKYMFQIMMLLEGFSPSVLAHEINHVMWALSDASSLEMNPESQEWQSCMIETIMEQCLDQKSYERYD